MSPTIKQAHAKRIGVIRRPMINVTAALGHPTTTNLRPTAAHSIRPLTCRIATSIVAARFAVPRIGRFRTGPANHTGAGKLYEGQIRFTIGRRG